jgi:ATP-dependent exoDNAse (exonuclease V) alpha subunit
VIPDTSKKIEQAFCKEKEIKNLINSILSIKRQKGNEHENESPEIKLGRRLVQRSFKKLSEQILDYLIERYDIKNNYICLI